jgi:hypothetical protein
VGSKKAWANLLEIIEDDKELNSGNRNDNDRMEWKQKVDDKKDGGSEKRTKKP